MVDVSNYSTELLPRKAITSVRDVEGQTKPLWGTLDGALITEDYVAALVADGRVFHARVGSASTAVALDSSWANTDPDLTLDVPAGMTVIPLRIAVVFDTFGTDAVAETMTLVSQTAGASSAGTLFASVNYRLRHTRGSACKVYVGPTVTSGYTGTYFELFRDCYQLVGDQTAGNGGTPYRVEWNYLDNPPVPLIEGAAQISTWGVSTTPTGYIDWVWAEIPSLPSP